MATTNTKLPSPNSRRNPDPSNKPQPTDITVHWAIDAGAAVCTLSGLGVLNAIPRCVLTGPTHTNPLYPITAEAMGAATVVLTFAETVEIDDLITWPARDPAIRSRFGGYVMPEAYPIGPGAGTSPVATASVFSQQDMRLTLTFDQDIVLTGGFPPAIILGQDSQEVTFQAISVYSVAGATLVLNCVWADTIVATGTVDSTNLGSAVAGLVGGIAATDFAGLAMTTTITPAAPIVIHAVHGLFDPAGTTIYFNTKVDPGAGTNTVIFDDGANRFDNSAVGAGSTNSAVTYVTDNNIGASTNPATADIATGSAVGVVTAIDNIAATNVTCNEPP